jgi:Flp pilus assembly secretin CpaC
MMALFIGSRGPVCGSVRARFISAFALALGLAAVAAPADAPAADIQVALDQARLVKLPEKVSTIVIGNPLIADAAVQAGGLIVITGKGYGSTNIIALDRAGAVLMEGTIRVAGPEADSVVVYRGITRQTYSCMPNCEPRITPGDAQDYFVTTLGQSKTRSDQAQGIGSSK